MAPNGRGADGRASGFFDILGEYYAKIRGAGWLEIFHDGAGRAHPTSKTTGPARKKGFQKPSKECPAFAAEFAAVTLRVLRGHHGTVNRHAVQINPELDDMFSKAEALIEAEPTLFAAALADTREKIA